jgi:hypothetical protein
MPNIIQKQFYYLMSVIIAFIRRLGYNFFFGPKYFKYLLIDQNSRQINPHRVLSVCRARFLSICQT